MSLAGSFRHIGVARAYRHRPPYPPALFDALEALIVDEPRHVLDLGAGDGALARALAARVARVDAVEISPAMVDAGRTRPGGDRDNLIWHVQAAETLTLPGPYALVTAGASLHWMQWAPTLAYIVRVLAPGAMLAIAEQQYHALPWRGALNEVIVRHSRNPTYDPSFSLPDELVRQGLFTIHGRFETPPAEFCQPVADYIEQFHSTASLARELMPPSEAELFADSATTAVSGYARDDGQLAMHTVATLTWGRPRR